MSQLTVAGLWKGYAAQPVLRGVDLEIPVGSLTAVLGLSGCGKTTLLRVIAGFERAERGRVALGALTLEDAAGYTPPERRGIGYVPQEGSLFPHLTVAANVGFGLSRRERHKGAVEELLEMVGLTRLGGRLPHQLSGGEQQRVALARALARRPQVLLLDEPFSSLDASLRSRMREEIHTLLREQGVTTVLVTHDQEEALSLADAVAVLRDGEIVQRGTPQELYSRPADARLARFLGAANLITATFEDGTARTPLGALELRPDPSSPPGVRGMVLLRPEQLEVHPGGQAIEGLAGRVEQCRYYGHDALLHIRAEEPCGSETLLARVRGEQALPAGTAVLIKARGPATRIVEDTTSGG